MASLSFSLKNVIGCPYWLNTPPILTPEASQATSNGLEKSGSRNTGAPVIFSLSSWKALDVAFVYTKSPLRIQLVIGATIVLNSWMNLW